jgi:hypothetical protein
MKMLGNSYTRTVDEFIERSAENYMEFQNSSHYTLVDGVIMEDFNIFRDRYYDLIMHKYTKDRILSEDEFKKYRYRPKRLSNDLYGSIDYWYILLMINKMTTSMEFVKKRIKILTMGGIAYCKTVFMKEELDINANKKKIAEQLKEIERKASL